MESDIGVQAHNVGLFPTTILNTHSNGSVRRGVAKEPLATRLSTTETGTPVSDNMFTASDDAHTCTEDDPTCTDDHTCTGYSEDSGSGGDEEETTDDSEDSDPMCLASSPRRRPGTAGPGAASSPHRPEEIGHLLKHSIPSMSGNDARAHGSFGTDGGPGVDFLTAPGRALDKAEEIARRVWEAGWDVVHHQHLPKWLRDNDFLHKGHRPPLNSVLACFKSIFRIHTETGNIWTHLLGCIAFIGVAVYFLTRPSIEIQWQEKAVFSAFFAGAILCMGFSFLFHTMYCHSERVGKLFNKLDYCGIALLTVGSFVPWLYYSFYCRLEPKVTYLALIFILGTVCIVVSMWDKFAEPKYRSVRAGTFIALGLSGVIPAMHYTITDGIDDPVNLAALGWLILMAVLYISGAVIYAVRIPERLWPGKFDIWFQSHQIFHVFVVAAAFVHYHGISEIANYRLTFGDCLEETY